MHLCIFRTVQIFHILKFHVPKKVLLNLYYSLVYPYLIYCVLAWGSTYKVHINKLVILQKRIIRSITFSPYRCHTNSLFLDTKILKIPEIFSYFLGLFAFKMDLSASFSYVSHDYITRNSSNPVSQFQRLITTQKSLNYLAPKLYSSIPVDIRNCQRESTFKFRYKNYLLSKYAQLD